MKTLFFIFMITAAIVSPKKSENNYVQRQERKELKESIARGSEIYNDFCVTCHMAKGDGIPGSIPPLNKSDFLLNKREPSIKAIKYGMSGEVIVNNLAYNSVMAAMGLEDDEIADVMNYILNSWSNKDGKMVTTSEVSKIKK